jgi:molybdate transport system substrate-binding protein
MPGDLPRRTPRGMKVTTSALLSLLAALAVALPAPQPAAGAPSTVTVFAAASLREAFEAAAPAFTARTGFPVTFDFGGSDSLERQLEQGAPADAFASASDSIMKLASSAGLLASAPATFARNRLVLVMPAANPGHVEALADLARPGVKVVMTAETVPVGRYARQAFRTLAGTSPYAADFAAVVERNVVSNELDVKAVATKISLGEADAGIVYATDVTPELAPKVRVTALPPSAPEATYPIAALKSSQIPQAAQAFVDFILGPGQKYLRARGFIAP